MLRQIRPSRVGSAVVSAAALALAVTGSAMASDLTPRGSELEGVDSPRIIGGVEVTDQKQNPGAVLLSTGGRQHCSAMRISPTWVISAYHCQKVPPAAGGQSFVIDGVWTDSVHSEKGPKARVIRTIPAPKADTLLIEIDGKTPGPIVPWTTAVPKRGEPVVMMGWGNTAVDGYASLILKKADGKVGSSEPGQHWGGENIVIHEVNGTAWYGDSGGPVLYNGKVFGDLSWGSASMEPVGKRVNGYVPFDQNADWIKQTTGVAPDGQQYYYTPGQPAPGPGPAPQPTSGPQPTSNPQPTRPTRPPRPTGWPGRP